jgi:hypothetical protein
MSSCSYHVNVQIPVEGCFPLNIHDQDLQTLQAQIAAVAEEQISSLSGAMPAKVHFFLLTREDGSWTHYHVNPIPAPELANHDLVAQAIVTKLALQISRMTKDADPIVNITITYSAKET